MDAVRAPEAIAARLRELGAAFDLSQVRSLHAPLAASPRPMEMCVHGGGFVRGDEAAKANTDWYVARQGFVTVPPDCRPAPDSRWPSGPQDIARRRAAVVGRTCPAPQRRRAARRAACHGHAPERPCVPDTSTSRRRWP